MSAEAVFIDSNVIISSLLSKKGASYLLLNQQNFKFITASSKPRSHKAGDEDEVGYSLPRTVDY